MTDSSDMMWQPLASRDLDIEQSPKLRMSAAGHCPASIAYAAHGFQETDPPDDTSRNRMAMGHFLEVLILRGLEAQGWEITNTVLDGGQLEISIEVNGETITGHPDGICRHPEWTAGMWVLLECKSMSVDRALEVEEYGVPAVYPSYLVQAALYAWRLHEMGLVAHPGRAVFGMMDREGRFLAPERVKIPSDVFPGIQDKFHAILDQRAMGMVPTPPLPQSSSECGYCSYHRMCWGAPPPRGKKQIPIVKLDEQDIVGAAQRWHEAKPVVDEARDVLQKAANANDGATVEAGGVVGGYFSPRQTPVYDAKALDQLVPADILRQCRTDKQPDERLPFWVREARRR